MAIIRFLLVLSGTLAVNVIKRAVFDGDAEPQIAYKAAF